MGAFFGIVVLLALASLVLVIWALVDAVSVPDDSMYQTGTKLIWVLVILLGGFIGSIVYLIVGRPTDRTRRSGPAGSSGWPPPPPPPG